MPQGLLNPKARHTHNRGLFSAADYAALRKFYDAQPALAPTPLRELPHFAASLGVGRLFVKDESHRFGLNAFKVLGVRYAVEQLRNSAQLRTLTCATAGNHGRAVAHVARELGLEARIYIPAHSERERIDAIASEGAAVVVIDGTYEDAVRTCAADAARHRWTIVSDTGWPGYEEIPRTIMLGYTRLFDECASAGVPVFSDRAIVIVQAGVGGLAAAALSWMTFNCGDQRPFTIVAEPESAACVMSSLKAGYPHAVSGRPDTIMAGLRCAEISTAAWPALTLADACVTVTDDETRGAMRRLAEPTAADPAISAGPSGACGLAALMALLREDALAAVRRTAAPGPDTHVIIINTERGLECGTPASHNRTPAEP